MDSRYDSIDSSYSTAISSDETYLSLLTYKLFKDPTLVKTADFAWTSGLWRFMTPVSHEVPNQRFTEVLSPSTNQFYVYYEYQYLSASPSDWLLGDFTPKSSFNTWTGPKYAGFRGVVKSYFPTECIPAATSLAATAISQYTAFKTKLSIADSADFVDNCSDVAGTAEIIADENFRGPFYFSYSAQTVDTEN